MIAFNTLSNVCSQAIRATLVGLPAARNRLYISITGRLHRSAKIVVWNNAVGTSERPALIRLLPVCEPESIDSFACPSLFASVHLPYDSTIPRKYAFVLSHRVSQKSYSAFTAVNSSERLRPCALTTLILNGT